MAGNGLEQRQSVVSKVVAIVRSFGPHPTRVIGLKLERLKIAVVKSTNHFRAGFDPVAKHIFYVKGPGAITGEFERIPYRHRPLNYWPRVADPFA